MRSLASKQLTLCPKGITSKPDQPTFCLPTRAVDGRRNPLSSHSRCLVCVLWNSLNPLRNFTTRLLCDHGLTSWAHIPAYSSSLSCEVLRASLVLYSYHIDLGMLLVCGRLPAECTNFKNTPHPSSLIAMAYNAKFRPMGLGSAAPSGYVVSFPR